jgi:hypothetical protein
MTKIPAIFLAASAALSAPAFAERVDYYLYDPVSRTYIERSTVVESQQPAPLVTTPSEPLPVVRYSPEAAPVTYADPAPLREEIIVNAPRQNEDQMITNDVVDRIASDPRISGQVGVQTYRNTVTLTGKVGTPNQADLAATDARSVPGVHEVNNELRARIGNF